MRSISTFFLVLMMLSASSLAIAQVTADNEQYKHGNLGGSFTADLSNSHEVVISKVDFSLVAYSPDREVPWAEEIYTAPIPGGIEPGEVYTITGGAPVELRKAGDYEVIIELTVLRAYNAAGEEID